MSLSTIELDIPGSSLTYGIASQFNDYAVRVHLVKSQTTQDAALTALHTLQGVDWDYHHVIPNLPLQSETCQYAGIDRWMVTQRFWRGHWDLNRESTAIRQNFRFEVDMTPVFIKSSASKTNGLPYSGSPASTDFFLLPLDGTGTQQAYLPPAAYMYERRTLNIVDVRTYDAYPMTSAQAAALGKVNDASLVINTIGLTLAANTCRFVGAEFDMISDGTGSTGRWTGGFHFKVISGGHYQQRAYWDTGTSTWKVANDLLYESTDLSIF